jgi:uncharacterized protein (DUF779 family)
MHVVATAAAIDVVAQVRGARPGQTLTFVFGSGCCEGTAPHLFADYVVTAEHQAVGDVAGVPVLADTHVRRLYDVRTVTIDAEREELADGFSAEIPLGWRFVLRSAGAGSAGI